MRKASVIVILFVLLVGTPLSAQNVYHTAVFSNQLKSLLLKVEGERISAPFIRLGDEQTLEVSFDMLNQIQGSYAYAVIHCDENWTPSALIPLEYMDGFQGMPIDDYAQAMTTTTQYVNYRLYLPNENIRFKVSGNYVLLVYPDGDPDRLVFTARFCVYESLVDVRPSAQGNTDISFNTEHQQVDFEIDCRNMRIEYPQTDLKINVYQNYRTDNMVRNVQPSVITDRKLTYHHNRALIFDGGNEYRRIEFLTHSYNGMGIERIRFFNPYYHADVATDRSRADGSYLYDEDQNGRFFINCASCNNPDTESDYYVVHFGYASERLPGGKLYLFGDFIQNRFDNSSLMEYNSQTGRYEKALLLKQGYYNYQYAFVPDGKETGRVQPTEGNYFQTENEYTVMVYYRPMGARYDRLIGLATAKSR